MGTKSPTQIAAERKSEEIHSVMRRRSRYSKLVRTYARRESGSFGPEIWCCTTDRAAGYRVTLNHNGWSRDVDLGFTYEYFRDPGDTTLAVLGLQSIAVTCDIDGESLCLVRYNHEQMSKGRGTLIHVWQPDPLLDRVHWRLPGSGILEWNVEELLAFLLDGALAEELSAVGF